jgi:HTH-type transcriptional regulator/antitoxin HipB
MSLIHDFLELSPNDDYVRMSPLDDFERLRVPMRIRTAQELGLVIRERRRKLGLSQKELAIQAQVGRQWLIAIEQGRPGAEIGLLLRTVNALGLQLGVDDGQTEKPAANAKNARPAVDLDAIIDRARGRKP